VLGAVFRTKAFKQEEQAIAARAQELLDYVGIGALGPYKARTLSYGDQRRLEIARALATDPKLIALDEPAAGMNATEKVQLRELISAGEPLNPEVIEQVRAAWDITIRDGYGQTETTAQVGNSPGQRLKPGSMGRALPGYRIVLLDADGQPADGGELCIDLSAHPLPLMEGYADDAAKTAEAMRDGYYHTGDVGLRDADGTITYVGRADDVFKASGYRISPFELESALIEHPAVAEAAVVPSPDPVRGFVPKAYVIVAPGHLPDAATAKAIFGFLRERVSPYKMVRRIEFADLPKTISGKIRRVELRGHEKGRPASGPRNAQEFLEESSR
jgi:acetyl-CoA synthetase